MMIQFQKVGLSCHFLHHLNHDKHEHKLPKARFFLDSNHQQLYILLTQHALNELPRLHEAQILLLQFHRFICKK
jgi:hypothetical protein